MYYYLPICVRDEKKLWALIPSPNLHHMWMCLFEEGILLLYHHFLSQLERVNDDNIIDACIPELATTTTIIL